MTNEDPANNSPVAKAAKAPKTRGSKESKLEGKQQKEQGQSASVSKDVQCAGETGNSGEHTEKAEEVETAKAAENVSDTSAGVEGVVETAKAAEKAEGVVETAKAAEKAGGVVETAKAAEKAEGVGENAKAPEDPKPQTSQPVASGSKGKGKEAGSVQGEELPIFDLAKPVDLAKLDFKFIGKVEGSHVVHAADTRKEVLFSAVAFVESNKFYFTSDGLLGSQYSTVTKKTKATCLLGGIPDVPAFAAYQKAIADYDRVCSNVASIEGLFKPKSGEYKVNSILMKEGIHKPRSYMKLSHHLFERKEDSAEGSVEEYSLQDWPVSNQSIKGDLERLARRGTHRIVPIPIFEVVEGKMVTMQPEDYAALKGCIVDVTFSIVFWDVTDQGTGERSISFNANPQAIRIVERSASPGASPRKRAAEAALMNANKKYHGDKN